jgi:predicted Zn-dependent peptidase
MLDNVQLTTLANGARVISAPIPNAESAALGIWVRVGGRYEPAALSGASHFIEHMLFKGTRRRSARAISQAIEGRGGYLNAYTQEDGTCFYARLPHEYQEEAFDVLADMYREPRLAPADLARERDVIVEELRMYRDQPHHLVQEQFTQALWPGQALGRPLAGSERTLAAFTRDALDTFRRRHYTPRATVFAFSGRVAHADCLRLVREAVARLPAGGAPGFRSIRPRLPPERCRLLRRNIEQVHVVLGFRVFGRHDRRRHALRVLNGVLGENMSSRLFQLVRERHGLAYSIQSGYQLFDETGSAGISAGLDRRRARRALELIGREIRRIRDQPITRAEWRRTRDYLIGQFRLGLEGASSQMTWAGETLTHYGRYVAPREVLDALAAVTIEDVGRVARQVFDPRRLSLSLVVPQDDPIDEAGYLGALGAI